MSDQEELVTDILGVVKLQGLEFPVDFSEIKGFFLLTRGREMVDDMEQAVKDSDYLELVEEPTYEDFHSVKKKIGLRVDTSGKWQKAIVPRNTGCAKCERSMDKGSLMFFEEEEEEYWCNSCVKKKEMLGGLDAEDVNDSF